MLCNVGMELLRLGEVEDCCLGEDFIFLQQSILIAAMEDWK